MDRSWSLTGSAMRMCCRNHGWARSVSPRALEKNRAGLWKKEQNSPFCPQDDRERTLGNSNITGEKTGGECGRVVSTPAKSVPRRMGKNNP